MPLNSRFYPNLSVCLETNEEERLVDIFTFWFEPRRCMQPGTFRCCRSFLCDDGTVRIHTPHFWHAAARPQSSSICEAAAADRGMAAAAAPFKGEIFRSDPWKNQFPLLSSPPFLPVSAPLFQNPGKVSTLFLSNLGCFVVSWCEVQFTV